MTPTLVSGDHTLVSKLSYGVRLPFSHTKIFDTGVPERGDVAVFRYPPDPNLVYFKRVVGLPGDTVVYENRMFTINGELMTTGNDEPYINPINDRVLRGVVTREEVLGDIEHEILEYNEIPKRSGTVIVPEGHYFMVCDNRDRSNDSRFWGFVPEENLVGKAKYIWMHWNKGMLWSRIAITIR